MTDPTDLVRICYAAFNDRDIEAVLASMTADVDWPNAWEGGRVRGHDAVRDYWMRQREVLSPRVEPQSFDRPSDGTLAARVRQVVHDRHCLFLREGLVVHRSRFRDGLIAGMDVEEP